MEIAVLSSPSSWYLRDLRRAAGGRQAIVPVRFTALAARIDNDRPAVLADGDDLRRYAAIIVRSMPPGSLEQVVFRMDALARLQAAGAVVVNTARAIEAAVDKYLALAKLEAAGFAVPPTVVCQTRDDALAAFESLGGDVVVKPLFGGEGRGICRVSDADLAFRTFSTLAQLNAVLYLQPFVPHEGCDLRLFVVGPRVLGMRRQNRSDWRTNVGRGGTAEPLQVDDRLADLARGAAAAIGAEIAGVDVLPARDGRLLVLEVNAVPGWQALARSLDVDVAALVLEHVLTLVGRRE